MPDRCQYTLKVNSVEESEKSRVSTEGIDEMVNSSLEGSLDPLVICGMTVITE